MKNPAVYIAENISTEKILAALKEKRQSAYDNHASRIAEEQARFEQEIRDIEYFMGMFHCSNYEK